MAKVLPTVTSGGRSYQRDLGPARGLVERDYESKPFDRKLRRTCDGCNNGWMSRIEDRAKPFASDLMLGRKRRLPEAGQATLAFWGAMKAAVLEADRGPDCFILEQQQREIYDARDTCVLPPGFFAWIGQLDQRDAQLSYQGRPFFPIRCSSIGKP